jgi:outer membrane murein-binding lipoprotein Lpp
MEQNRALCGTVMVSTALLSGCASQQAASTRTQALSDVRGVGKQIGVSWSSLKIESGLLWQMN